MTSKVIKYDTDGDEEATWDAEDWCYMVVKVEDDDDIICICATQEEADHISALLNKESPVGTATTG